MRFSSTSPIDGVTAPYYPSFLNTETYLAGETISIGHVVAINSLGKWMKATAEAAGNANRMLGIALSAGVADGQILVALPGSTVDIGGIWSFTGAGHPVYVSTTAGGLTETAPSGSGRIVRVAGFVTATSALLFVPEPGHLVLV